jgi:RHS repeat-associated protein
MPGREHTPGYRYGFNGQESVDEVYGADNYVDFAFRGYNPRLGRFFAVDPLAPKYPELTPYQFASNTPIWARELEGLEANYTNDAKKTSDEFGEGPQQERSGPLSDGFAAEQGFTHYGIAGEAPTTNFSQEDVDRLKAFGDQNTSTDCFVTRRGAAAALIGDPSINKIGWKIDQTWGESLDKKGYFAGQSTLNWEKGKMTPAGDGTVHSGFDPRVANFLKEIVGGEKGIFGFGLDVGNGYHTMTLIYNNTGSSPEISLLDNNKGWSPKLTKWTANQVESKLNSVSLGSTMYYDKKYGGTHTDGALQIYQYQKMESKEIILPR